MMLLTIILQVALEVFARNPELAAGNLCGYFPQDTMVSAAPKGYKPFYISHIARHGSRFNSNGESFQAIDTLALYAAAGQLTEEGLALMADLKMMHALSEGNYGALTGLGAEEHRQICARMVRHYPEVFADKARTEAVAYSTESPRVVASMKAFLGELSARVPGIDTTPCETRWDHDPRNQEVGGYHLNKHAKEKAKAAERDFSDAIKTLRKGYDYKAFGERIFRDPSSVPSSTVKYLAKAAFKSFKTGRVTEPQTMPSMGKYFTTRELYSLWVSSSIYWAKYLTLPGYTNPMTTARGGGILACIVKDADEAIARDSHTAATFRFSHDTMLLPLMASIPLEGTVLTCDDTEIPEHFQDYNYVCPACNVQLIFYRGKKGKPVLVKFLLNEKETLVHGLAPVTGCYYDWERVKQFFLSGRAREWAAKNSAGLRLHFPVKTLNLHAL